jgi:hypothetical protein
MNTVGITEQEQVFGLQFINLSIIDILCGYLCNIFV